MTVIFRHIMASRPDLKQFEEEHNAPAGKNPNYQLNWQEVVRAVDYSRKNKQIKHREITVKPPKNTRDSVAVIGC